MFRSSSVLALALFHFVVHINGEAGNGIWSQIANADDALGPSMDQELVERSLLPTDNEAGQIFKSGSIRDLEHLPHSSLWGHKYIGGGAGEGKQYLSPSGTIVNKQEVKTDAILPAYCDPPNPCPPGFTSDDGCVEEFENTAEFSRQFQSSQNCLCDEEHMYTCPPNHRRASQSLQNEVEEFNQALSALLQKADIKDQHKTVAKKFHEKKRRAKRNIRLA